MKTKKISCTWWQGKNITSERIELVSLLVRFWIFAMCLITMPRYYMRFGYLRYKRKDRKGEKDRKSRKEMGSDDITDDDNSDPVVGVDRNWFCPSEVNLIAIGWEQFFEMKVRVVLVLRFDLKDGVFVLR